MTADQMSRLDSLDLYRLEPKGDDWEIAWQGVDIARSIRNDHLADPSAPAIAALWMILKSVDLADRRLAAAGRTSADDNADLASDHVRKCLDSLCGRVLRDA
jgi:hypothetical protein